MHKHVRASHDRARLKRGSMNDALLCPDVNHVLLGGCEFGIISIRDSHGIAQASVVGLEEGGRGGYDELVEQLVELAINHYGLEDEEDWR